MSEKAVPRRRKPKEYTSTEEYFRDLESWISEAYFWYGVTAAFPYYLVSSTNRAQQQPPRPPPPQPTVIDGIECKIPSLWKRIAAEAIDFFILFFLKLAMTFIAVDFFDIVDLDKFDFVTFQKDAKLEYKVLLQMTHDIIILELVHRVVVCIFEAFWLQGGANGRLGGATPGKSLMGLRVISCQSSTPLPGRQQADEVVVVRPGTDLGLTTSLIRAVVKNLVVTFLIPAGFAFLYFRHNRTGYDIICNTIVVQEPLVPHRTTATNTATTNAQT